MRRDQLIGRTIAKRFRVKRVLGEGGMATVFVAEQDAEPHEIALKILRPELCADKTFAKRFEREARAAARVQHPCSVSILEAGVDGELSYIAMELLRGDDLFALLERHGALSPRAAASIVADVCDALAVAHGLGIVHRDLKPENIMIVRAASEGPDGPESVPLPEGARVKVLDFGIAKLLDNQIEGPRPQAGRLESPTGMTAMTRVGTLIGTPAYMSPEQCAQQPVDTRSDIYTCGLLLFQMVSGRLPFDGPSPLHIATKHIHEDPPPLRSFVPDADAALEALILKALAKRPADRWLTARALAGALRKMIPSLIDRPYSVGAVSPESASTPVLLDDSVTSLRDAGLPANIGEPPSERMASAKTMVADGLVAAPPSVVVREPSVSMGTQASPNPGSLREPSVSMGTQASPNPGSLREPSVSMGTQASPNPGSLREPEVPRRPLAILRHAPSSEKASGASSAGPLETPTSLRAAPGGTSEGTAPPRKPLAILARHSGPDSSTPTTVQLAPEDAESFHETPAELEGVGVEAEPEDLASTLIRATPGEGDSAPAPGAGRQLTMQSAAPVPVPERSPRVAVLDVPPAPAAPSSGANAKAPAAVQTLVTGQPAAAPSALGRGSSPDLTPSLQSGRAPLAALAAPPAAPAPPPAAPYAGPPALVPVPAKMPTPVMPAASVILSPSVTGPQAPIVLPAPTASGPRPPAAAAIENPHAIAPTFGIPSAGPAPGIVESGTHPMATGGTTVGRALWLGVIIGVLGSAILFALAYAIFLAK